MRFAVIEWCHRKRKCGGHIFSLNVNLVIFEWRRVTEKVTFTPFSFENTEFTADIYIVTQSKIRPDIGGSETGNTWS